MQYKKMCTPLILTPRNKNHQKRIRQLLQNKHIRKMDVYSSQLKEYIAITHPVDYISPYFEKKYPSYLRDIKHTQPDLFVGNWIFYPWQKIMVRVLPEKEFLELRTSRNKYLIEPEEQKKFYNAKVAIAGLSVGNSIALNIVLSGGARSIVLADFDVLDLSNTNRIRVGIDMLGMPKVWMTALEIYNINPYARITVLEKGVTHKTISQFLKGADIVIDEIDQLAVKLLIRQYAKKSRIPVVMAADAGDNAVIDVERYDLDPRYPFFHGKIGNPTYKELNGLSKLDLAKKITQIVGPEHIDERMYKSLKEIGKTIVSWPQLGGAALLNGSAVTYLTRRIVTGKSVNSGRFVISLDEKCIPGFNSRLRIKKRKKDAALFKKQFGI